MNGTLPTQFKGKKLDYVKFVDLQSIEAAQRHYQAVKLKLLDVNNWYELTKGPSAVFHIVDAKGNILERSLRYYDYIRIDIPGPGVPSADGYDWVRVEELLSDEDKNEKWMKISLRPCADPTGDNPDIAHFFEQIATSTFLIEQRSQQVIVRYAGRNEIINTENESFWDNARNYLVGLSAKIGASYPQWKALVDGLSELDDQQQAR